MNEKQKYIKSNFINSQGHLSDETIALYVESMILDNLEMLPDFVHIHKRNCVECNIAILELYSIMKDEPLLPMEEYHFFYKVNDSIEGEVSVKTDKTNWIQWIKIAAVFLIFSAIGFSIYLFSNSYEKDIDLVAFQELPELEKLVDTKYRNEKLEVTSPKIGDNFEDKILFKWKTDFDEEVYIQILNNKGEKVEGLEHLKTSNRYLLLEEKLKPGLYYWKLVTEGDMVTGGDVLYLGKFYYQR